MASRCIRAVNRHKRIFLVVHIWWWRHQMETFSALLAFCAGNSPVTGEFPAQSAVTRSFGVSLVCAWIYKQLGKQWLGWWFETPPRPLWRHRNVNQTTDKAVKLDASIWRGCNGMISKPETNDWPADAPQAKSDITTLSLCLFWHRKKEKIH